MIIIAVGGLYLICVALLWRVERLEEQVRQLRARHASGGAAKKEAGQ